MVNHSHRLSMKVPPTSTPTAESGLRFIGILLFFIWLRIRLYDQNSCIWPRYRKDSVSSRIAIRVPLAAPYVSPSRPDSTNAAIPAMRFATPVRHPHSLLLRPAGDLWRDRPI